MCDIYKQMHTYKTRTLSASFLALSFFFFFSNKRTSLSPPCSNICASFNNKQMIITLPQDEYLMTHTHPLKSEK